MEFENLTAKLAEIREKVTFLVDKINAAANGDAFYARITLRSRQLTGLIKNLRVNQYKIIFDFTEERLIGEEIVRNKIRKKIPFEKIRGTQPFQTASGKPMLINTK